MNENAQTLWVRWTAANALAELAGLGLTFTVIGWSAARLGEERTTMSVTVAFIVAVLSGSIEATIVGLAQWWAMRPAFPMIGRFAWWSATLIGALAGYVLGNLPSTLMDVGETTAQAPFAEPPQWMILLLAAGLGAVSGAVLSFAQWLVLRGKVQHAGLWIPANMLAWTAGMPIVFQAVDWAFKMPKMWLSVSVMAAMLLLAGAVVGAIHGRFLVRMAG